VDVTEESMLVSMYVLYVLHYKYSMKYTIPLSFSGYVSLITWFIRY